MPWGMDIGSLINTYNSAKQTVAQYAADAREYVDEKAGTFVENHAEAVEIGLTATVGLAFLVSRPGSRVVALASLGGCNSFQASCPCPPISNSDGSSVDPVLKEEICASIDFFEDEFNSPDIACNVSEIVLAPEDEMLVERVSQKPAAGENNSFTNRITLNTKFFSIDCFAEEALFHELMHSRQDVHDLGWKEGYDQAVGYQIDYLGDDWLEKGTGLHCGGSTYGEKNDEECDAELKTQCALEYYYHPDRAIDIMLSPGNTLEDECRFAGEQFGIDIPLKYPREVEIAVTPVNPPEDLEFEEYNAWIDPVMFDQQFVFLATSHYCDPECEVLIYPYDSPAGSEPSILSFPLPDEVGVLYSQYWTEEDGVPSQYSVAINTMRASSIVASGTDLAFIWSNWSEDVEASGSLSLVVVDTQTGESQVKLLDDLPDYFDPDSLRLRAYADQVIVLPEVINYQRPSKPTYLEFPAYNLAAFEKEPPLRVNFQQAGLFLGNYEMRYSLADSKSPYLGIESELANGIFNLNSRQMVDSKFSAPFQNINNGGSALQWIWTDENDMDYYGIETLSSGKALPVLDANYDEVKDGLATIPYSSTIKFSIGADYFYYHPADNGDGHMVTFHEGNPLSSE